MIPFYVVCGLWVLTVLLWQLQVHTHHRERMQTLKLFKAANLTEFDMAVAKGPNAVQNYFQAAMEKANRNHREAEYDE